MRGGVLAVAPERGLVRLAGARLRAGLFQNLKLYWGYFGIVENKMETATI